jgi:hypothetical protein
VWEVAHALQEIWTHFELERVVGLANDFLKRLCRLPIRPDLEDDVKMFMNT